MINFAENLNKMITAGLGGETEAPRTEVAVGHRVQYLDASGPVASFDTTIVAPLKKLILHIPLDQLGSGDPSPENQRPIVGHGTADIQRSGINVWNGEWENGSIGSGNGANVSGTGIRTKGFIPCLPGVTYFPFNGTYLNSTINMQARFYDAAKNYIGFVNGTSRQVQWNAINPQFMVTIPQNCRYFRFALASGYGTEYHNDISINMPYTDRNYHEPDVESKTLDFGQPVYGASVDVISGSVTVTHAMQTVSDTTWTATETPNVFRTIYSNKAGGNADLISSVYKTEDPAVVQADMPDLSIKADGNDASYVYVKDTRYSTAEEFASAQAAVQIAYALNTPWHMDVEPQQITTAIGVNNICSAAGSVDVTYTYYEETEGY